MRIVARAKEKTNGRKREREIHDLLNLLRAYSQLLDSSSMNLISLIILIDRWREENFPSHTPLISSLNKKKDTSLFVSCI